LKAKERNIGRIFHTKVPVFSTQGAGRHVRFFSPILFLLAIFTGLD
jgi:hypothetical protein